LARFNAAKRESVWFNPDMRKAPFFDDISAGAFGIWWRLTFLADDRHALPELAVIAKDGRVSLMEATQLVGELVMVGLVEIRRDDTLHMTALSQRYYAFTEVEADAREAAKQEEHEA